MGAVDVGVIEISHENPKRGEAAEDRQLSQLQRRVLLWLFNQESEVDAAKLLVRDFDTQEDEDALLNTIRKYQVKGVHWSTKKVLNDVPTRAQITALSKALGRLESRGLVITYDAHEGVKKKSKASHVKLLPLGIRTAFALIKGHGMSARELHTLPPEEVKRRSALWLIRKGLETLAHSNKWVHQAFAADSHVYIDLPGREFKEPFFVLSDMNELELFLRDLETQLCSKADTLEQLPDGAADVEREIRGVLVARLGRRVIASNAEITHALQNHDGSGRLPFPVGSAVMLKDITADVLQKSA